MWEIAPDVIVMSVVAALRPPPLQPSREGYIWPDSSIPSEQSIRRKGSESSGGGVTYFMG